MELPILYEDEHVVAVHKPAGVMTHPDGRSEEKTVSDWFAAHYPASAQVGEAQVLQDGTSLLRPGIVHRLDRETSGVLVLTKTHEAHTFLKNAFANREVHKEYLAFVYGVPKERKGRIEFSIGRSRKDFRLRSAQPKAKGTLREAVTEYEVRADNGSNALLLLRPLTGRTHQIRVHLKAIHHPVVGDALYAPGKGFALSLQRLALHAYRLDIPLLEGGRIRIEAPIPDSLKTPDTLPLLAHIAP